MESGSNMDYRIVVKTPNQQFDDVVVHCDVEWTVKTLKDYLAEAYPTKPESAAQKLIHSGKLLTDEIRLKDIFNQEHKTHTLHMVCSVTSETVRPNKENDTNVEWIQQNIPELHQNAERAQFDYQRHLFFSSLYSDNDMSMSWEQYVVLMHKYYETWKVHQEQMQQWLNKDTEPLLNWQRGVITWFMHSPKDSEIPHLPFTNLPMQSESNVMESNERTVLSEGNGLQNRNEDAPDNNVPVNNVNPPQQMNAGGAVFDEGDDENEDGRRDWLDWVHMLMRASVMLSILYFYSSTMRIVMIGFLGLLIYLYQNGWLFHRRRMRVREAAEDINQAQERNVQENENPENAFLNDHNDVIEQSPLQTDQQDPPYSWRTNTLFTTIYTFFTSFFTSLLPQGIQ